jgi:DNA-binding NtrC family response regulator
MKEMLQNLRILHIDDEIESHQLLSIAIKGWRGGAFELESANSERVALENLKAKNYALIFLDLHLGARSNGLDLLPKIRKIDPHSEVIILSADASFANAQKAIRMGAADFVKKGYGREELLFCMERALERIRWKKIEVNSVKNFTNSLKSFSMIGKSRSYLQFEGKLKKVAPSDVPVFISGETGSGKELAAKSLHLFGYNPAGPFIPVNCSAIPISMAEAYLFGHEKGAFTGADQSRAGVFEEADSGTLFLDEVNSLPLELQGKLLRVLQEKEIRRVGGKKTISLQFRLVSAANEDLKKLVRNGRFREDLFFRLNVVSLEIPPLRERKEDILALVHFFLPNREFDEELKSFFLKHPWRGNIRELKNVLQRLEILFPFESVLKMQHLEESSFFSGDVLEQAPEIGNRKNLEKQIKALERKFFEENYLRFEKNVSKMARELSLDRSHLHQKLILLGIRRAKS